MDDAQFDILNDLDSSETETTFNKACDYLQHLVSQLDANILLEFYGLFKQATVGRCNTSKPGIFSVNARAKWNAWNDLGSMTQECAMLKYIAKMNEIEPDWNLDSSSSTTSTKTKKPAWVSVSTPMQTDNDNEQKGTKTFIDHVKDGNVDEVIAFICSTLSLQQQQQRDNAKHSILNDYDADGLGAIHWAADRGYANILEILLKNGADVNLIDKDQVNLSYQIRTVC